MTSHTLCPSTSRALASSSSGSGSLGSERAPGAVGSSRGASAAPPRTGDHQVDGRQHVDASAIRHLDCHGPSTDAGSSAFGPASQRARPSLGSPSGAVRSRNKPESRHQRVHRVWLVDDQIDVHGRELGCTRPEQHCRSTDEDWRDPRGRMASARSAATASARSDSSSEASCASPSSSARKSTGSSCLRRPTGPRDSRPTNDETPAWARVSRAGDLGLEPRMTEPESAVLPITPIPKVRLRVAKSSGIAQSCVA